METVDEKFCDYNYKEKTVSVVTESGSFPTTLENSINKIIKKEGYKTYRIIQRQISTDGGNYLGDLYEVDIKGKTKEGNSKENNLFMKHIVGESFTMLDVHDAYRRELFTYTELFKIFNQIQDDANLPLEERYKMAKAYEESNSEVIILENLSRKGFMTKSRLEGVSLDFAKLSIKQLAKFHGLSLVLKEKRPDYFEKQLKPLTCTFQFNDDWFKTMRNLCNMSIEPLDYDDKVKMLKFIDKTIDVFAEYSTNTTSVGCCLCHGDYRANNILTKEENGVSVEVVPVDFQLIYYGCPINDLAYFIFTGTEQSFRAKHLDYLKNLYHETLGQFLKYYNLDVEDIYPRKEFERQYKEKLDIGLMYALFTMSFIFAENDDIPDISKELDKITVKMSKKFEDRVKGLVHDFKTWGYM